MSISVKTTDGRRIYEVAQELNMPVHTVSSIVKKWDAMRREEILSGRNVNIFGLVSLRLYYDIPSDTIRVRSKVSRALRALLRQMSKEGLQLQTKVETGFTRVIDDPLRRDIKPTQSAKELMDAVFGAESDGDFDENDTDEVADTE